MFVFINLERGDGKRVFFKFIFYFSKFYRNVMEIMEKFFFKLGLDIIFC